MITQKIEKSCNVNGHYNSDTEHNLVTQWLNISDDRILRTHKRVDADAAFSAALILEYTKGVTLELKPASCKTNKKHILAVDMLEGKNAVKGLEQGSAFGLLVDVLGKQNELIEQCFRSWADQLNLTDSGIRCDDNVILAELIQAWRSAGLGDKGIVSRVRELIRGKLNAEKSRKNRQLTSQNIPIYGGVAIVVDSVIDNASLYKRGAKAIVQQSEQGQCVHLSRKIMKSGHNLTELKHSLPPSWFIHPQGFIAAFGTLKAPKDPSESGISIEALLTLVQSWIKEVSTHV